MLNEMRFGTLSAESIRLFKSLSVAKDYNDGIDPTELFPTRREVDDANEKRMRALGGEKIEFKAEDWTNPDEPRFENKEHTDLTNMMVPKVLELKVNAQVMLLKNLDADLVNGTIGKVIGFGYPDPEEDEMDELERMQYGNEGDFKPAKAVGPKGKVGANGQVELPPRVEWTCINGLKRVMTMEREEFKTENTKGQKRVHRKQVSTLADRRLECAGEADNLSLDVQYPMILFVSDSARFGSECCMLTFILASAQCVGDEVSCTLPWAESNESPG